MIQTLKVGNFIFDLVTFPKSSDLFDKYLKSDEEFGLKRADAVDKYKNAYIAGLTNVYKGRPFIFINTTRMKDEKDIGVVPHEIFHLALIKYTVKQILNKEEGVASFIEEVFKKIVSALENDK